MDIILTGFLFTAKWNDYFLRSPTTYPQHTCTRQTSRSAHEFQEIATRKIFR